MKKMLIVMVSLGLALGASAQHFGGHGGGYHVRGPRLAIGFGAGYPFFNPYYGAYSPFGYPYRGGYGYSSRPSRLELQVQDIKLDYSDRIKSVKMDRTIRGRQRRQVIRQLKNDRDRAIVDAKRNYYYNRSSAGRAPANNNDNFSE
jgi:hypothetical protein